MRNLLISNHPSFLVFYFWVNYEGDVDGNNSKTSRLYCHRKWGNDFGYTIYIESYILCQFINKTKTTLKSYFAY